VKKLLAFVLCFGFVASLSLGVVGCDKGPAKTTTATTPAKTTTDAPTTAPKTTTP
jgi:hypothetical protein